MWILMWFCNVDFNTDFNMILNTDCNMIFNEDSNMIFNIVHEYCVEYIKYKSKEKAISIIKRDFNIESCRNIINIIHKL